MLCYRDRCYCCHTDCETELCFCRVTPKVKRGAQRVGLPLCLADLSNGKCYTNSNKSEMRNEK